MVARQTRLRLRFRRVGARVRLGDAHTAEDAARCQHWQVLSLLLLRPVLQNRHAAERMPGHDVARGGAGLRPLLRADGGGKLVGPGAAVLPWRGHAYDAQPEQLADVLGWKFVRPVNLRRDGLHLVFGKGADHLADPFLFTGQGKIQGFVSSFCSDLNGSAAAPPRLQSVPVPDIIQEAVLPPCKEVSL